MFVGLFVGWFVCSFYAPFVFVLYCLFVRLRYTLRIVCINISIVFYFDIL